MLMLTVAAVAAETTDAAGAAAAGGANLNEMVTFFAQFVLFFVVFYLLFIRPQRKKIRELEQRLGAMRVRDKVITAGGILGTVVKVIDEDNAVTIDIGNGVTMRVVRDKIIEVPSLNEKSESDKNKGETKDNEGADKKSDKKSKSAEAKKILSKK